LILDTIGCAIGGYSLDLSKIVLDTKREIGGLPEATILVVGDKTSCASAAYVNTAFSNALDADETLMNSGHHAGCAVMSALAMGERLNASGRQFVEAVAVGYEVAARIGLSLEFAEMAANGHMVFSPVAGVSWATFGAAVAAAKMMGLDEAGMIRTLGIAGYSAPVSVAGKWATLLGEAHRPMTKYGLFGPMAEIGVTAALLAQKGFQSDTRVLDGERGFWRMTGSRTCDWDVMLSDLGDKWYLTQTSFKPYPACRYINGVLDLFLSLVVEHQLTPDDIDEVRAGVAPIVVNSHLDAYFPPENEIDVQFSIPYLIAIAAFDHSPSPQWQSIERRQHLGIAEFAQKVSVTVDDDAAAVVAEQVQAGQRYVRMPCSVSVKSKDQLYSRAAAYSIGDPWSTNTIMSDRDLEAKFRRFSSGFLQSAKQEGAIEMIRGVDRLDRLSKLVSCLH
jgi:2-methylcitrate dehydratase PrpD